MRKGGGGFKEETGQGQRQRTGRDKGLRRLESFLKASVTKV